MEDYGVPGILFIPAVVLEILFPLLLIVGYKTKWAASVMALFTFTVAIIFHTDFSEWNANGILFKRSSNCRWIYDHLLFMDQVKLV